MEKNYIWIFTLEIFQNFYRCCIPLKTFLGQSNFSGEKFFRERHVFRERHFFLMKTQFSRKTYFSGQNFFWKRHFLGEKFFWGRRIFEEFLRNRAENLYTYSSKGMEGPRALHFPKFPENFPQFSNPKKLFSFLKCRSFKFFFSGF